LRPWLSRLHGIWSHLVALALTSALAGTFSAPYGAYHFGHVQMYFILANMIAVPITASLVMPAGLVALALMPLHLEFLALAPMRWGISAIIWVAHACSDLPAATLSVPHIPVEGLAILSFGLAWIGLWRTRLRLLGLLPILAGLASPLVVALPDVLVAADARLIGYHSGGQLLLLKTNGGSEFTQDAWQQYWNTPDPVGLDCASKNCLLASAEGGASAILVRGETDPSLCAAALLISAEPIRLQCREPVAWVDRFSVWRDGAHAIWLGPGPIRILTDREARGDRPWVIGLPTAGRVPPGTVTAKTDDVPTD
jgi:competence protein ComEC